MANENTISLPVVNFEGKQVSTVEVSSEMFGIEPHLASVQLVVKADLANQRQATAKTKVRSEVSGGGKKPWRQKGTGRARAGSTRSPIWVGGGTVFGPDGRQNYKLKVNKKVHSLALYSVLSDKVASNDLIVLDDSVKFSAKSSKAMVATLKAIGAKKKVLFVVNTTPEIYDENLLCSCNNIENLSLVTSDNVSVYDVLHANTVVMSKSLLESEEN